MNCLLSGLAISRLSKPWYEMPMKTLIGRIKFQESNIKVTESLKVWKGNSSRLGRQNKNRAISKMLISRSLRQALTPVFHFPLKSGDAEVFTSKCMKIFSFRAIFPCYKQNIRTAISFDGKFPSRCTHFSVLRFNFCLQESTLKFREKIRFRSFGRVRQIFSGILTFESKPFNLAGVVTNSDHFHIGKINLSGFFQLFISRSKKFKIFLEEITSRERFFSKQPTRFRSNIAFSTNLHSIFPSFELQV